MDGCAKVRSGSAARLLLPRALGCVVPTDRLSKQAIRNARHDMQDASGATGKCAAMATRARPLGTGAWGTAARRRCGGAGGRSARRKAGSRVSRRSLGPTRPSRRPLPPLALGRSRGVVRSDWRSRIRPRLWAMAVVASNGGVWRKAPKFGREGRPRVLSDSASQRFDYARASGAPDQFGTSSFGSAHVEQRRLPWRDPLPWVRE